jgi:hypothetical protein
MTIDPKPELRGSVETADARLLSVAQTADSVAGADDFDPRRG